MYVGFTTKSSGVNVEMYATTEGLAVNVTQEERSAFAVIPCDEIDDMIWWLKKAKEEIQELQEG